MRRRHPPSSAAPLLVGPCAFFAWRARPEFPVVRPAPHVRFSLPLYHPSPDLLRVTQLPPAGVRACSPRVALLMHDRCGPSRHRAPQPNPRSPPTPQPPPSLRFPPCCAYRAPFTPRTAHHAARLAQQTAHRTFRRKSVRKCMRTPHEAYTRSWSGVAADFFRSPRCSRVHVDAHTPGQGTFFS